MGDKHARRPAGVTVRVGRRMFRVVFAHQLVVDNGPSVVLADVDRRCLTVSLDGLADGDATEELYARIGRAVVCAWTAVNNIDNPGFTPIEAEGGHA
jgi:hypothetical protein